MSSEAEGFFSGKHLVIFGCGDIGGYVARDARQRGLRVTALTRNAEKAAALRVEGIATVVADLGTDAWHAALPERPDFILNAVSSGGGGIDGYRRSYLEGMTSVLAWAEARKFSGTLVYTGSTSVYPQDGGVRVDESAETSARDERAAVLVATEKLLCGEGAAGSMRPFRAFVLRLAGIYGPGRRHLLDQVRAGEVSGRADQHLNLIHRDDAGAAIWAALGAPAAVTERVFNVADDGAATKGEVVAWLAERMGVARPSFTGHAVAGRGAVTPDRIILNGRIKAALGWRPQFPSFREGYLAHLSRSQIQPTER